VGPQTGNVGSPSLDKDAWPPSGLLDANVEGARDGSWSCLCFIWICFTAKPSLVGANVDGLACFLHHRMVYGWQTWVQCFLIGLALSRHVAVVGGVFSGCAKPSGLDIYCVVNRSGT
jgi:hypothetical protein